MLMRVLRALGVEREEIWITNAALCRSRPERAAIACCRPRLDQELRSLPRAPVLVMGALASQSLLGDTFKITEMAGTLQEADLDGSGPRNIIPTIHPAAILRGGSGSAGSDRAVDLLFWNFAYDAAKIHALSQGRQVLFSEDLEIETEDPRRARQLMQEIYADAKRLGHAAIDVETTGIEARHVGLTALAVATEEWAVSLSYNVCDSKVWQMFRWLCNDDRIRKIFHNRIFDEQVLDAHGVEMKGPIDDTLLKHHAAFPGASHHLQHVAAQFFAIRPWKAEFRKGTDEQGRPDTIEHLCWYNAQDALATARLDPELDECVERTQTRRAYDTDNALAPWARRMEKVGVPIDLQVNEELRVHFAEIIRRTRREIESKAANPTIREKFIDYLALIRARVQRQSDPPDFLERHAIRARELKFGVIGKKGRLLKGKHPVTFSISNPDHVAAYIQACGHRLYRMTPGGKPSTKKDILEEMGYIEDVRTILEFRAADKMYSTFVVGVRDRVEVDGRLHPNWKINKITGRWGSSPNCFDGETEILTEKGWIRFDAFRPHYGRLRVAQFDLGSETIEFVLPKGYFQYDVDGSLVRLANQCVDFCGTADHRMLVQKRGGAWEVRNAEDFIPDRKVRHGTKRRSAGTTNPEEAWITFLCAAQADGWWQTSGWCFTFSKRRKIERLVETLDTLGLDYTAKTVEKSTQFKQNVTQTKFYVKAAPICREIRELLGADKCFGRWLLDWSDEALDYFLTEIMHWDGSWTRKNCYSSSVKPNADWVQIVALLRNRRANVRPYHGSKVQTKTNWQVDIVNRNYSWTTNLEPTREPFSGTVYCVSVPSEYIVVRRNGKPYVCGNCQNWPKENFRGRPNLRRQVVAPKGRKLVGADFSQLEARIIGLFLVSIFMENFGQCDAGCKADEEPVKFCPKHDIHTVFAVEVFARFLEMDKDSRKELRDLVKRGEYGGFYKGAVETLYASIVREFPDVTLADVAKIVRIITEKMPLVDAWHQQLVRQVMQEGCIRSAILGRMRAFPLGNADMTVVVNFPVQSSAADIMDRGMLALVESLKDIPSAEVILQIHDALVVECAEADAEEVRDRMTECLSQTHTVGGTTMFFPAKAEIGDSWDQL
jgi:DNA polymerase I-like protein with 3'-5' exonuclease and polymerase domains